MFIISQYALQKSNACNNVDISTYSIVTGLVIYGGIYLYFLFYNNEYLSLFNKFVVYILGIDLLLSTFYTYNTNINENKSFDSNEKSNKESEDLEETDSTDVETDDSSEDILDLIPLSFENVVDQEDAQANAQVNSQEDAQANTQANTQANAQANAQEVQVAFQESIEKLDLEEPLLDSETLETVKKLQQENDMSSVQSIKKKRGRKPHNTKATM